MSQPAHTAPRIPTAVPKAVQATLLAASSLTVMSGAVVSPALPAIAEAFKADPQAALLSRLVITMPALAIALTGLLAGVVADALGRRRLLLGSLVLYVIAGTSGIWLDELRAILVGRFALGVAVAGVMTAASAMIGDLFEGPARQRFLGIQAACMAAGGVIFVPLGGALSTISYHWPFAVYGLALILIPMVLAWVHEPERRAVNASGGASAATNWPIIIAILVLAALFQIGFYMGPVQAPFFVKEQLGGGSVIASIAVALMTLCAATVSLRFGIIARRLGPWPIAAMTALGMGVGYWIVSMSTMLAMMLVGLAVAGLAVGLIMPNVMSWMMRVGPDRLRGRLTGSLTAAVFLGQFLSPIVAQPMVRSGGTPHAFAGMAIGLGGLGVMLVVVAAMARRPASATAA